MSTLVITNSGTSAEGIGNPSSLVDLLRWRAANQRDQAAFIYLLNGEEEASSLTYGELDYQARAIAAALQASYQSGTRALLLYPPGLEFIKAFFGCLYAGVIAIPAYPPHPSRLNRTLPKLQAIALDAEPAVVLTNSKLLASTDNLFQESPLFKSKHWLATDCLVNETLPEWHAISIRGNALAFLQYTSGSTAMPKGVMLSHRNLLHNAGLVYQACEHSATDSYVSWLPTFHDMGFMAGILQPLYGGFPVTLMSPASFLQRPVRWLQAISRRRATTSGGPNFAYELCVRKISDADRARLDLSSWTIAFNGAEPIRAETLEEFARVFAPCGFRREAFYPCYGLAEATLIVSGSRKSEPPIIRTVAARALDNNQIKEPLHSGEESRTLVGCGSALMDQEIVIINPQTLTVCSSDQVGEICVSGPSVAAGYWNRPADTEYAFKCRPIGAADKRFLRTGDLGFMQDGELFVTGRLKDLLIIGGSNYYPQDIELTTERSHKNLRPASCAAFSIDVASEERLVVVIEVERHHLPDDQNGECSVASRRQRLSVSGAKDIVMAIQRAVAEEHELQVHQVVLLKAGSIFKTSSGKIQRHLCRKAFLASDLDVWG